MKKHIIQTYAKDKLVRNIKKRPEKYQSFEKTDSEFILFKKLVYISMLQRTELIQWYYKNTISSYYGIDKTEEKISRIYYFPEINRLIQKWITEYNIYKKTKYK